MKSFTEATYQLNAVIPTHLRQSVIDHFLSVLGPWDCVVTLDTDKITLSIPLRDDYKDDNELMVDAEAWKQALLTAFSEAKDNICGEVFKAQECWCCRQVDITEWTREDILAIQLSLAKRS